MFDESLEPLEAGHNKDSAALKIIWVSRQAKNERETRLKPTYNTNTVPIKINT